VTINGLQQTLPNNVCVIVHKSDVYMGTVGEIFNIETFFTYFWYNLDLIYKGLINLKNLNSLLYLLRIAMIYTNLSNFKLSRRLYFET